MARRADGGVYWQYQRLMSRRMPLWAGVRDHLVVAVWCDDWVVAIDVPAGRVAWSTKLPAGPDGAHCLGGSDDQRVHSWTVHTSPGGRSFDVVRAAQRTTIDAGTGQILN